MSVLLVIIREPSETEILALVIGADALELHERLSAVDLPISQRVIEQAVSEGQAMTGSGLGGQRYQISVQQLPILGALVQLLEFIADSEQQPEPTRAHARQLLDSFGIEPVRLSALRHRLTHRAESQPDNQLLVANLLALQRVATQ